MATGGGPVHDLTLQEGPVTQTSVELKFDGVGLEKGEIGPNESDRTLTQEELRAFGPEPLSGPHLLEQALEDATCEMLRVDPKTIVTEQVTKTLARFAVPVKKSVLQTPPLKTKPASVKKPANRPPLEEKQVASEVKSERRSSRLANKPSSGLSVEEQATALLIKKCGITVSSKSPSVAEQNKFHTTFVGPMEDSVVGGMREAFGLPEGGAEDSLSPLLIDAGA